MKSNSLRAVAGLLVALIMAPLAGCGSQDINAESPYGRQAPMRQEQPRQGMSTKQKMLLLAGAAAVYYMYNKHKNREGQGPDGRYFLSKNGRVYYRDLKTGDYRWVDPPTQPIRVPAEEYERYTGRDSGMYDEGQVIREAPRGWNQPGAYR